MVGGYQYSSVRDKFAVTRTLCGQCGENAMSVAIEFEWGASGRTRRRIKVDQPNRLTCQ